MSELPEVLEGFLEQGHKKLSANIGRTGRHRAGSFHVFRAQLPPRRGDNRTFIPGVLRASAEVHSLEEVTGENNYEEYILSKLKQLAKDGESFVRSYRPAFARG